jgi:biopolymer transport protein ExbB/TolQ
MAEKKKGADRQARNTLTDYGFLPRLQGKEKEKLWLWIWTTIVIALLLVASFVGGVNLLKSEEIAKVLIKQTSSAPPPVIAAAAPTAPAAGPITAAPAKKTKEQLKKEADMKRARSLAVEKAAEVMDKAKAEFDEAANAKKAAVEKYKRLRNDDNAKPADRNKARDDAEKKKEEHKQKEDSYLLAKASLEALRGEAKLEQEYLNLEAKKKEMTKAREEWEKAQAGGGDGDNRSILSLIIEYTLMLGLWLTFAITFAAGYLVYNVRRSHFYRGEEHRSNVVQALVHVVRVGGDPSARWEKWHQEKLWGILSDRSEISNHLDEVVNQVSRNGVTSDAHIDRYFAAQARDIKDEEYNRISVINLCAAMGPILGFAGTVLGMILAFGQLGAGSMSQDMVSSIAGSINVALVTTLLGLLIKGMAIMMRTWVHNRIDNYSLAISLIPSEAAAIAAQGAASEGGGTPSLLE